MVCFVSASSKNLELKVLLPCQDTSYELLGIQMLFQSHNSESSFKAFVNRKGHRSSLEEAFFYISTLPGHFKVRMPICNLTACRIWATILGSS